MTTDDENSVNQTIQIGIPLDGDAKMLFGGTILSDQDSDKLSQAENLGALKFTSNKTPKNNTRLSNDIPLASEIITTPPTTSKTKKPRATNNAKFSNSEIYSRQISEINTSLMEIKEFLEDQLDSFVINAVEEALHKRDLKNNESKSTELFPLKNELDVELQPKDALINIENIATYSFKYSGVTFYDDFIVLSLDESQFTVDLKSANLTLQLASHPDEQFHGVFLGRPFKPFPNVPYSILVFLKAPPEDTGELKV